MPETGKLNAALYRSGELMAAKFEQTGRFRVPAIDISRRALAPVFNLRPII